MTTTRLGNQVPRTAARPIRAFLVLLGVVVLQLTIPAAEEAHAQQVVLDENCVITILNRTSRVKEDGSWRVDNVPSNFGPTRARATCIVDGQTVSGASGFFVIQPNQGNGFDADIPLGAPDPVPASLTIPPLAGALGGVGATAQLVVTANFTDGSTADVAAALGVSYTSTNPAIVAVSATGEVTAVMSGTAAITALFDGAVGMVLVGVVLSGDSDGDGIPDDVELAAGLNPDDPLDGLEDPDGDGLTNKQELVDFGTDFEVADTDADGIDDGEEVVAGADGFVTNPLAADSDGDGIDDGEEVVAGADGFITDPLVTDSDGDGLSDGLEIATGSDPTDALSFNLASALQELTIAPELFRIELDPDGADVFQQLTVTGELIDGTFIDVTEPIRGTVYSLADPTACSFGFEPGRVFGDLAGICAVTASIGGFSAEATGTVVGFTPGGLASIKIPGFANNVDVQGSLAYVAAGEAGLQVVDVSVPGEPVIVGAFDTPGNANDVKAVGTLAYIADGSAGLQIVDVSDPTAPVGVGAVDTPGDAHDLAVSGAFAYVADGTPVGGGASGLNIIDISVPGAPAIVGTFGFAGSAEAVAVTGTVAAVLVGDPTKALQLIHVSVPAAPTLAGSAALAFTVVRSIFTHDVEIAGDLAYLVVGEGGFVIVDILDPTAPAVVATTFQRFTRDVAVANDVAFIIKFRDLSNIFGRFIPFDVSDPTAPLAQTPIQISTSFTGYTGTGIVTAGNFAFVSAQFLAFTRKIGVDWFSRLFVVQHSPFDDSAGVAPTASITTPTGAGPIVQGQDFVIEAAASDDVAVASVEFLIDGVPVFVDTAAPFEFETTFPEAALDLEISVRAYDYANTPGNTAVVVVPGAPDLFTTVEGTVVDGDGFAVEGAVVSCLGAEGISDAIGDFSVVGIPTTKGPFACHVVFDPVVDAPIDGQSITIAPIPLAVFDVGTIELRSWTLFATAHAFAGQPSSLYQIDSETGAASLVGNIGFKSVSGMDFDPIGETLYATGFRDVSPSRGNEVLFTIDQSTGAGTEVGSTTLDQSTIINKVPGLTFRASDGVLYAYIRPIQVLMTIDIATGETDVVDRTIPFSTAGNALTYSPDDTLYLMWSDFVTTNLATLDPIDGRQVEIGQLFLPVASEFDTRVSAAAYHPPTGLLYGVLRGVFVFEDSFIVTIDTETRDVTIIGQSIDGLDALAWVRD